jgi:hypothetical protein
MRWPGPGQNYFAGSGALKERSEPWLPAIKKSSRARKQFPLPAPAAAVARTGKTLNLYYYVLAVSALCPNAFSLSAGGIAVLCVARLLLGEAAYTRVRSRSQNITAPTLSLRGFNNGGPLSSRRCRTLRFCLASEGGTKRMTPLEFETAQLYSTLNYQETFCSKSCPCSYFQSNKTMQINGVF